MATVTVRKFAKANENFLKGLINDLSAGGTTVKCALMKSAYTPDYAAHDNWGDVAANEIDPATYPDYAAGGVALGNKAVTTVALETFFDADDAEWTNATITAAYAVVYDDTPEADADKKLLACGDFDGDKSSTDGTFKVEWHENGIFKMTAVEPT